MMRKSEQIVDWMQPDWKQPRSGAKGDPDWSRRDLVLSVDPEECVKCNNGTGTHSCWRLEIQQRS